MAAARADRQAEFDALKDELEIAVDDAEVLRRHVTRLERELAAARDTSRQHELGLQAAMDLVRARDAQVVELREQVEAQPEAVDLEGAGALLQSLRQENDQLRQALVRAEAGEAQPIPEGGSGGVRLVSMDLGKPVALVNGAPLTRRGFVEFLYRDLATPELLGVFIDRYLVEKAARAAGIEPTAVEAETWVSEQVLDQVQQAGGEAGFLERIKGMGYTRDAWESRLRYLAKPTLMLHRLVEQNRETPLGSAVWEARLQAAYRELYSEVVSARHIFFAAPEQSGDVVQRDAARRAETILRDLAAGADFSSLARDYSQDPSTNRLGGLLGEFQRDKFSALPRLNTALFTAPVGEPVGPVRSREGYHVILVDARRPPERSYDREVREELAQRLQAEPPSEDEQLALLEALRARAQIEPRLSFETR
ncbi:MAG: peptidylprolyl isomerase [Planctomycetes bacterium]|nr:peptidylprolyl isomerase [Planctomycetota bacterium]